MPVIGSRLCIEHGVLQSRCSSRVTVAPQERFLRRSEFLCAIFQRPCLPSFHIRCCLQFSECGGWVWCEWIEFERLRYALVHIRINKLSRLPSLTHTQWFRPLRARDSIIATSATGASSSHLSTQLRRAQTRNTGFTPVAAPVADHPASKGGPTMPRKSQRRQLHTTKITKIHEEFNEAHVSQRRTLSNLAS